MANSSAQRTRRQGWASFEKFMLGLWKAFYKKWGLLIHALAAATARAVHGADKEREKRVVDGTWRSALLHCSVHLPALLGIIVLSYLNFVGFFIGGVLQGLYNETAQDVDRLLLQITAKLLELLIIASLGVLVRDIVRDKLLFGSEGVPLGLITAMTRFVDITYIVSHEFRAGCRGFERRLTRWIFALLVITCALIAILAGPSTALVLIPVYYTSWPAGGASFWLNGDLRPTTLDRSSSWDPRCTEYAQNSSLLNSANSSVASCIWAGIPYLAEAFKQRASSGDRVITYSDSSFKRDILLTWGISNWAIWADTARVTAVASNLVVGAYSQYIGQSAWCDALFQAPQTQSGHSLANLRYRTYNGTRGSVRGSLPVVRTQCFNASNYMDGTAADHQDPNTDTLLPFPIIPDYSGRRDLRYYIPLSLLQTTQTTTQWIPIPSGPSNTSYGSITDHYPSAFLLIQNSNVPGLNSPITCSIQADWVPGTNVASRICWGQIYGIEHQGVLDDSGPLDLWSIGSQEKPDVPTFQKAKGWQQVNLTTAWLDSLTPTPDQKPTGRTILASILEQIISELDTTEAVVEPIRFTQDTFITISSLVASFVADGMSRVGYAENYADSISPYTVCYASQYPCGWRWQSPSWTSVYNNILKDNLYLEPDPSRLQSSGSIYHWSASVGGYGIRATSTAYYLAFTVLFMYALLALCHVAWTLYRRRASWAWSSLTDLLMLSQSSPPPADVLKNTSAGVATHATSKLKVRIRHNPSVLVGSETLQLLLGKDGVAQGLEQVRESQVYGAQ